jgi:hypothetical protein
MTNNALYNLPQLFLCNMRYCLQTAVDKFEASHRTSLISNFYRLIFCEGQSCYLYTECIQEQETIL